MDAESQRDRRGMAEESQRNRRGIGAGISARPGLGELRRDRFLSLRELSAKAGVSKSTIVAIEAGRVTPQPRTIRKLAEALGVHPRALV